MKLKNKTILITGASSGIGRAMAIKAAKDGATVLLSARNIQKLQEVASEVEKLGSKAEIIQCDVTDLNQVKEMFLKATSGVRVLDVVYNNAGLGHVASLTQLTTDQINSIIDVNIKGMIQVAKYTAEVFSRQRYGHLLMTSSMAGLIALPQWSVYVGSKWAITGFAACIRSEFKQFNSKVTTIHPGLVKTEFFDKEKADLQLSSLGGAITAEKVAEVSYNAIFTNKKKVLVPFSTSIFAFFFRLFPSFMETLIAKGFGNYEYHQEINEDMKEFDYIKSVAK